MNLSLLPCLSAFLFAPLAYASDCGQSLDGAPQDLESALSPDDRAVRWLKDLLGPVTNWPAEDARAAVARLLAGSRESPVSESAVNGNADLQVHRQQLAELMHEVSDPVAVGRALQEELNRREGTAQRREETRENVEQDLNFRIHFGEIPPATFSINVKNNGYDEDRPCLILLERRLWMQLTPVTLWQLGAVLPRLGRNDRAANSPAGDLSWYEAQEFVDELNQWARTNDPRLLKVVPGHQPSWRYSLPHAWEWMYVASNLATNSSGVEAWRKNDPIRRLTLGGLESVDQAARFYRDETEVINWEVGKLDPMIINENAFHDLSGIQTWLRPDPWGPIYPVEGNREIHHVQPPGITPKEFKWFNDDVLGKLPDPDMPISVISVHESNRPPQTPFLGFSPHTSKLKHPSWGIRLIAFEADAATDARLDPSTPVDEAATIARLGAAFLAFNIDRIAESTANFQALVDRNKNDQNRRTGLLQFLSSALSVCIGELCNPDGDQYDPVHDFQQRRGYLFKLLTSALKDWKQGRRNQEFDKTFESKRALMKIFQHPALDLRRFAIEVEAQLKAREVMP